MAKFWELLERSVIVQSLIALGCVGAIIYLTATGREVPEVLIHIVMLVIGFYFGSKAQQEIVHSLDVMGR